MSQRIIFAGTPDFAAQQLRCVLDAGYEVVAVYTQPDRATGRGQKLVHSPVKSLALEANIPVEQPSSLKDSDAQAILSSYDADLMIVVAYGQILPQVVLDMPRLGCINIHASLLPRWRGAAPIERAIEAGDSKTGVAIMQMDAGLDTGDVIHESVVNIANNETAASLYQKLLEAGKPALLTAIKELFANTAQARPQDTAAVTYAHKIEKEETFLDFNASASEIERKIRAFYPMRCCSFKYQSKAYKVHHAEVVAGTYPAGEILGYTSDGLTIGCADGAINITSLQLPGKKALDIQQIINGKPSLFSPGSLVGEEN